MGKIFKSYLSGNRIFQCSVCRAHLARNEDIVSKDFRGRQGRAFLFSTVVNVAMGKKEDRVLYTGLHTVADISCNVCQSVIGWKYLKAYDEAQKYKEDKYIIEKAKMVKGPEW
eukprot:CAMPEP_0184678432 /NCGR_PEP_ID=MMETSP0312-20130426/1174_1 /TAXON_ID=31354 /ORGANISM="Compsopogon coeruleus, Strain SAG 36.94" /LENGTH=112 /DNA_ID=CAMNT_0027127167 /DNA_START=541 /DNA_END=876 /DNA_ORIENTATION=-